MSLPGLQAQPLIKAIGSLGSMLPPVATVSTSPLEAIFGSFNTNLYFVGIMMLVLNLGGRFLAMEITKDQEQFFQNPWVRRFLIFVVLFVATRNLVISFWLTVIVVLVLGYLFNENSPFCILGRTGPKDEKGAKPVVSGMTPEEMEIFRRLNEKKLRYDLAAEQAKKEGEKKSKFADPSLVYLANMNLLNESGANGDLLFP
jgi:hypothetical protein